MGRFLKNVFFSVIVFFSFLYVCEGILRFIPNHPFKSDRSPKLYSYRENEFVNFYVFDPLLGWKNKSNIKGFFTIPGSRSYVEVNVQGLRDRVYPLKKSSKVRIAAFGDSFTWGYGVNQDDIWTSKLEAMLGADKAEVINFGVTGYGTDQEYLSYKTIGKKWKPDVIILQVGGNDFDDNFSPIKYGYGKPNFIIVNNSLELKNVPVGFNKFKSGAQVVAKEHFLKDKRILGSFIFTYIFDRLNYFKYRFLKRNERIWEAFLALRKSRRYDPKFMITRKIIEEFKREARREGSVFIIFLTHYKANLQKNPDPYMGQLWQTLADTDIPFIRTYYRFYTSMQNRSLFLNGDDHWNENGHQLAAEIIYDYLMKNEVLDDISRIGTGSKRKEN